MRLVDTILNNYVTSQYTGLNRPEAALGYARQPFNPDPMSRFADSGAPVSNSFTAGRQLTYSADGDILELDWSWIGRFLQRFTWEAMSPPESVRVMREYWDKRESMANSDGDKAEFGNNEAMKFTNKAIGYEGTSSTGSVEPKKPCSTCASRKYVDKSDDSSVSYQTPTKLNPRTAGTAIAAHENEHVINERAKAERSGRDIINQTVMMKYSICPECSIMYPSGGTTRTQSIENKNNIENNNEEQNPIDPIAPINSIPEDETSPEFTLSS